MSVRSAAEARLAIRTPVDILDLKEPRRGPLAPVAPELWREVAALVGPPLASPSGHAGTTHRIALSAALGERHDAVPIAAAVPRAFEFAKVGPSGTRTRRRLAALWQQVQRDLPPETELVAVAYADFRQADCLPPEAVFDAAAEFGLGRALLDTFIKDGRSTLDHLGIGRLAELARLAEGNGLWWALAGSLRLERLASCAAAGIAPNCVGVRGDVCRRDRTGQLDAARIARWQEMLDSLVAQAAGL